MKKHEEYNISFQKIFENNRFEFRAYSTNKQTTYFPIYNKLSRMSKSECEGLIEDMKTSQTGEYYEEYFALDFSYASDNDQIRLIPPNIQLDNLIISMKDMKQILEEWIEFLVND